LPPHLCIHPWPLFFSHAFGTFLATFVSLISPRDVPSSPLLDPKRVSLCQIAEIDGTWCCSQLSTLKGVRGAC
jgi:hypothetical protein